ncbi:endonuclease/exonuclease/phosphatase family protein [Pseudomonas sp. JL3]|uniref:endonuclease/exonuclease/phosphatase family protein n=1 Tax=Pseudomonas sp. JL3 TaxID=2919943 RepID=UPI00285F54C6|nr:endonuclease/exonuclease/phosphatase family protein [Pseudomonas sp. JL3]MDR8364099.1 endonuclease/exonuclease/phosphatase family protein [Pseudomonas sp. JL3]
MFKIFPYVFLFLLSCTNGYAATRIGTWNIEHLSERPTKDFQAIAKVAKNVDFLAVQELMNEEALGALAKELTQQTGHKWSSMASHAVGRSSYKEMYGFIWKDDAVAYEDGAVTYLDRKDTFEREPYSARFKSLTDNSYFVVATVHILYGKSQADRASEIVALSNYWTWLKETYPGNNQIMLMGDFNTPPTSPAWDNLDSSAKPLVLNGASTLSTTDGKFANLYDNIFVSKDSTIKVNTVQVFNYPKYLGLSHAEGRSSVSDHAPIFLNADLGGGSKGIAANTPNRTTTKATQNKVQQEKTATKVAIIGNRKTLVYHRPDCPSYDAVSEKNRVAFDSESDALNQHYRLAGNCKKA